MAFLPTSRPHGTGAGIAATIRSPRRCCCLPPSLLIAAALCRLCAVAALAGAPVALDAPSLPIVVAGIAFNIEPAAIRIAMQRHPGAQERVDLVYLWPSLKPPDPRVTPKLGAPALNPERAAVRDHRLRRRHAAADGTRADDLSALSGGGADRRTGRADAARLSRRHALSRRGTGVRVGRARRISWRAARATA